MNAKKYLIIIIILFLIERVASIFYVPASYLFPVFAFYLVTLYDSNKWLNPIILTSLLFDLFSGLPFGVYTFSIIVIILLSQISKKIISFQDESIKSLVIAILFGRVVFSFIISLMPKMIFASQYIVEILLITILVTLLIYIFDRIIFKENKRYDLR